MDWEAADVLTREKVHFRRIFKEAWFSKALGSGNRTFHELDREWFSLFLIVVFILYISSPSPFLLRSAVGSLPAWVCLVCSVFLVVCECVVV